MNDFNPAQSGMMPQGRASELEEAMMAQAIKNLLLKQRGSIPGMPQGSPMPGRGVMADPLMSPMERPRAPGMPQARGMPNQGVMIPGYNC